MTVSDHQEVTMSLPAFIIGGAPRSGTTWLLHVLEKHPDIFLAKPYTPEPKFFLLDDEYEKGLQYYLGKWFSDVGPNKVAGEKSTNYLENPGTAARIHANLPGVTLVFILREPADRAYNNYLWTKGNGLETLKFEAAIEQEEQRLASMPEKWRYSRPFDYFQRGLYAKHLAPFFLLFPREQILCLKYEDISVKPKELVRTLHRFLGVKELAEHGEQVGIINAAQGEALAYELPPPTSLDRLRERYSQANRELAELLPDFEMW